MNDDGFEVLVSHDEVEKLKQEIADLQTQIDSKDQQATLSQEQLHARDIEIEALRRNLRQLQALKD